MADHAVSLFAGLQLAAGMMVFAVAMTVLLGRWVTADENALGVGLRGGVLLGLTVLAFSRFGTIWYWLLLPLTLFPLLELSCREGLAAGWIDQNRQRRLAEAAEAAAEHATNAARRLNLARALLETKQIEVGLAALEAAVSMADEQSRELLREMAEEAKQEFVRSCPFCRHPNPVAAKVCRSCLRALCEGALSRALLCLSRPALRLLPRSR